MEKTMTFEQLIEAILKFKAKSEYKQAAIVILRLIYDSGGAEKIPLDAVVRQPGDEGSGGPKNLGGLLPCPHCRGTDIIKIDHHKFGKIIICGCGASMGSNMRDEWLDLDVEKKWNTRGGVRF